MKAIVYTKYGPPDVLQLKELKKPIPKHNELLIRVYAATVNRTDCAMLRAKPFIMRFFTGLFRPKQPILGTDFAGMIEAVGKNVASLKVRDKVFGFDDGGLSSQAEYMTLSEDNALATMPNNMTYEQAAASIEGAHYAYNFINKVNIERGQKVLVNGATGAIGSAAVQLLKYFGANVTAVCNRKDADLVTSLGANRVIDYTKEDFTLFSEKYNFVFDTVGKSTFKKCKPLLLSKGVYMSSELGPMVQNPILALVTPIFGSRKVKFSFPANRIRSVRLIKKLSEQEKFRAVIDRTYSLDKIAEAYRYVEQGQKIGNVVITVLKNNKT
ncbi:MAG: NAD(P)-dependent alcohol dehydrogenase [Desulfobacterales bacterium]|nr:NAD(P)-dependent alcohol dehydrogenase [Desulfobacterales bacterium]